MQRLEAVAYKRIKNGNNSFLYKKFRLEDKILFHPSSLRNNGGDHDLVRQCGGH